MEQQPQETTPPSTGDASDSLEGTSTVVEQSHQAPLANPTIVAPTPQEPLSSDPAPLATASPPPQQPRSHKRFFSQFNIYVFSFALLVAVVAVAIIFGVIHTSKPTTQASVNNQTLSATELSQLQGSNASVGDPSQTLTIQSDATFNGTVLAKGNVSVAGSLKIGGSLSLPGLNVSGTSSLGTLNATSLNITGDAVTQGSLTVQKNLSIAGSGTFAGTVSAPEIVTQNLQLQDDLALSHHIVTSGSTPTRANGPALGTGGTASVGGNDTAGTITINTGSNPVAGCFISLTFSKAFAATPHVSITPDDASAASLQYYTSRSSSGFSICSANAAAAGSSFTFDYIVVG